MDDPRGRWARRLGRRLTAAALGVMLPCVLASAAAAQGPETIPAGDPAPPVGLMVVAAVVGVALVAGGAALLIVGRRQARARADADPAPEDAELSEVPEDAEVPETLEGAEVPEASGTQDDAGSPEQAETETEAAVSETDGQPQARS